MNSIARTAEYNETAIKSIVIGASSHQLVEILFSELDNALQGAAFHAERADYHRMSLSITKASKILAGLQGSLEFETGGEIAVNLAELYRFCIKELFKINISPDKKKIENIRGLLAPIKQAWNDMPEVHKNK